MRRGASGINAIIAVDKPIGPSSHDVVARVRRDVGEGRVGHAGTLDPLASGVLVVGIGQGARLLGRLTLGTKSYRARIRFGSETTTDDAEGEETRRAPIPDRLRERAFAERAVASLVGDFDQVPPAYSAISKGGRRAYQAARSGEYVELEPRHVRVIEASLVSLDDVGETVDWVVDLTVSKGCYIRSIARDLGRKLGSAAHLEGLVRTASGAVGRELCLSLDELDERGANAVLDHELDPVELLGLAPRALEPAEADDVACGRHIRLGSVGEALSEGDECALVSDGRLMGIWHREGDSLVCSQNYPGGIGGVRG